MNWILLSWTCQGDDNLNFTHSYHMASEELEYRQVKQNFYDTSMVLFLCHFGASKWKPSFTFIISKSLTRIYYSEWKSYRFGTTFFHFRVNVSLINNISTVNHFHFPSPDSFYYCLTDMWGSVYRSVYVCVRACAGGRLLINHFSAGISCYWCQISKVNVSGKGLVLKTRLSTSWSIWSLSPLSPSLVFFFSYPFLLQLSLLFHPYTFLS